MNRRGEITIFLGLILLSVWAILCGLTESAPRREPDAICAME